MSYDMKGTIKDEAIAGRHRDGLTANCRCRPAEVDPQSADHGGGGPPSPQARTRGRRRRLHAGRRRPCPRDPGRIRPGGRRSAWMSTLSNCPGPRPGFAPPASGPTRSSPFTATSAPSRGTCSARRVSRRCAPCRPRRVVHAARHTGARFQLQTPGAADLRMDPTQGVPASQRLADLDESELAGVLTTYADEPHAISIARLLVEARLPDDACARACGAPRPRRGVAVAVEGRDRRCRCGARSRRCASW